MKGIKYNLEIEIPNEENFKLEKADINLIIKNIKEIFRDKYYIEDVKVSRNIIYNMLNRPPKTLTLISRKCKICKC